MYQVERPHFLGWYLRDLRGFGPEKPSVSKSTKNTNTKSKDVAGQASLSRCSKVRVKLPLPRHYYELKLGPQSHSRAKKKGDFQDLHGLTNPSNMRGKFLMSNMHGWKGS